MESPSEGIILDVDDTSPRIEYYPPQAWKQVERASEPWNPQNSTYHTTTTNGSFFFIQFHGALDPCLFVRSVVFNRLSHRCHVLVAFGRRKQRKLVVPAGW
jgi:hypothetical protein